MHYEIINKEGINYRILIPSYSSFPASYGISTTYETIYFQPRGNQTDEWAEEYYAIDDCLDNDGSIHLEAGICERKCCEFYEPILGNSVFSRR